MHNHFTVRVELHGGAYLDYIRLHEAMKKVGFSRTIVADNGTEYNLPNAEYVILSAQSCTAIRDTVSAVVAGIGKTGEILVAQTTQWAFVGLNPVTPTRSLSGVH